MAPLGSCGAFLFDRRCVMLSTVGGGGGGREGRREGGGRGKGVRNQAVVRVGITL